MQEMFLDTQNWDAFWAEWKDVIKSVPGLKEEMLESIGARAQQELLSAIDRSGLNDRRGRVKSWQNPHIGSGKGYVAIRADSGETTGGYEGGETVAIGALTNYLTVGHRVRPPSGRNKRYVPKARMSRVRGFGFYKTAAGQSNKIAVEEAEKFLKRLGGEQY